MDIGIISDTHDDVSNLKIALSVFNERKVRYVIHAGDYVFPDMVTEFKNFNGKLIGVLGNNDGEKICGHSHIKRDDKIGNTLVLNPGCAHKDFPNINGIIETDPSIIIFNTLNKTYQFVRLQDS